MSFLQRLHLHRPTKTTVCKMRFGPFSSSSSSPSKEPPYSHSEITTLTDSDLTKINHLIPRLCDSNQLPTALRLFTAALLANPPLQSLPLSAVVHSLTSQHDLTQPMSLLTHLNHTPHSHHYIPPITLSLLSSYIRLRKCNHALKVFRWLQRPDTPCSPDETVYEVLIQGLCINGLVLEALKAFRDMMGGSKFAPCCDSKEWVYRGLLMEARVNEAMEFYSALSGFERDGEGGRERVLVVLERLIAEWTE
ncbi:uncharacterized protein LOC133295258 [Gastrolobium bilobum]|uniref:uncharacterized protein LOC133295258 n=1 Tax=Gastrolobium bilobum TaxID=150636 RepID=UPI002AB170A4|nr:uncharacterized protein LOC133295258 [Gastrolobium bilobum]XP_061350042.1 uncharacterized protein LOC133295258 [Gastrolobium bilobum]